MSNGGPSSKSEAARIAALRLAGSPPAECGSELVRCAPARGVLRPWMPRVMHQRGDGSFVVVDDGFDGRHAARVEDAFDRMADQAARAGGPAPFAPAQVAAGRRYRTLVERHAAAGLRCASVEARVDGGGRGGGGLADALLAEARELARLRRRIGAVCVLRVLRARGAGRRDVTARGLVDAVCLGDLTLSEVLRAAGWAEKGILRARLRMALACALERMGS